MPKEDFLASIHNDYLPFIQMASDSDIAQFIRAQICQSKGEPIPELSGMSKALFEAHNAIINRGVEINDYNV